MREDDRIYIAGHTGMVGSAIKRALHRHDHANIVTRPRRELDLTDGAAVNDFFASQRIDCVFLAAAKVGGIKANDSQGADFIRDNLLIQTNVIDAACKSGVRRLLFLGSSCIYPKLAPQPMRENMLMTGAPEPTNQPYAVAKIAGPIMCDAYRRQYGFDAFTVMPCNVYGPGDNFNPDSSHAVAGMMQRMHKAKTTKTPQISCWGSGTPKRELIFVDDLAEACLLLMREYDQGGVINAGSGHETSIGDLAGQIAETVGYQGQITWDKTMPDGTPRKIMDNSRLNNMGWSPQTTLANGLAKMYEWYLDARKHSQMIGRVPICPYEEAHRPHMSRAE